MTPSALVLCIIIGVYVGEMLAHLTVREINKYIASRRREEAYREFEKQLERAAKMMGIGPSVFAGDSMPNPGCSCTEAARRMKETARVFDQSDVIKNLGIRKELARTKAPKHHSHRQRRVGGKFAPKKKR